MKCSLFCQNMDKLKGEVTLLLHNFLLLDFHENLPGDCIYKTKTKLCGYTNRSFVNDLKEKKKHE